LGTAALGLFLWQERRSPHPLLPLRVFGSRVFSVANAMTLLVYGGLGIMTFFLVLQLQVSSGYSPLAAGLSTLPLTIAMLLLSSRSGALATKIGPRWQMSLGPLLCGIGVLLLRDVDRTAPYFTVVLPGVVVFSLGLVALVAPLTATVLAAAPDRAAGLASGINNAVARTGSLLAVAALPALVGINGQAYLQPAVFTAGYAQAMTICAGLLIAGGAVSFVGLRPG
jgi:Major Facilitator Superfamily